MFRLEGDVTHLEFGTLSVKGQIANILGFAAQLISSTATPLCQCDEKAAVMIRKHTSVAVFQ